MTYGEAEGSYGYGKVECVGPGRQRKQPTVLGSVTVAVSDSVLVMTVVEVEVVVTLVWDTAITVRVTTFVTAVVTVDSPGHGLQGVCVVTVLVDGAGQVIVAFAIAANKSVPVTNFISIVTSVGKQKKCWNCRRRLHLYILFQCEIHLMSNYTGSSLSYRWYTWSPSGGYAEDQDSSHRILGSRRFGIGIISPVSWMRII